MMTEEQGVKAIIALQKFVGVDESEEKERANWRNFKNWEKISTEFAYNVVIANKDN
jgi:hypothetical protein